MNSTLNKRTFRECIDAIVKSFPEEDVFESLIHFLTTSVEVKLDIVKRVLSFLCLFCRTNWVVLLGYLKGLLIVFFFSRKLFLVDLPVRRNGWHV